ncbi:MAG: hypothetical protein GYA33_08140 [Thermogutta sp.]|nr:hypothetical protein [Thermogutta sp.]
MTTSLSIVSLLALTVLEFGCASRQGEPSRVLLFAGAASKPVAEEAAQLYRRQTGLKVELVFGGSGYVLSHNKLMRDGDAYFHGSSDYLELPNATAWYSPIVKGL